MKESDYLKNIISVKKGAINLQVVFVDISNYSKRKSTIQKKVINNFTNISQEALESISQMYIKYAQDNNLNFATDIIKIPTGDGLAIIFPFEGLQSVHLDLSKLLLEKIHKYNLCNDCSHFNEHGWCNCHDNFNVRIGISEGKGIIYKDLNENYNIAGNVINMASRIMQLCDPGSILLSEEAYDNLIDLTLNTDIEDDFVVFEKLKVKHGIRLNIYQYCSECDHINTKIPEKINEQIITRDFREKMSTYFSLPSFEDEDDDMATLKMLQNVIDGFGSIKEMMISGLPSEKIKLIEAKNQE